ncbi:MAG: DUF4145 domain-containing protein [Gemmatimonadales bacterium]
MTVSACPNCGRSIVELSRERLPDGREVHVSGLLWPDAIARTIPPELEAADPSVARDFLEAALVYPKSAKASAALSRRCLQSVLATKGGATKRDLADQIDEVLPKLPSQLAENVDAIRQVGNFAAHPLKSTSTGQILEVEDGEAEWLLDVLEQLFDYYYVAPARASALRTALNAKLADAKKPPLKQP